MLYVGFVDFGEKVLDAFVVLDIVNHDESHLTGGYERCHEPLIELVNGFEVHVGCFPLVFVY